MENNLEQRLAMIDMQLYFCGRVNRNQLVDAFGIGTATASRTLKEYTDRWPDNAQLVAGKTGGYRHTPMFQPVYPHSPEKALQLLYNGQITLQLSFPTYGPTTSNLPPGLQSDVVATITRAMVAGESVDITYVSGTSGKSRRIVHPRHLIHGGGAWYYRSYDEKQHEFRTFRFSRTESAIRSPSKCVDSIDAEWNQQVILSVAPHTRHPNPAAHALDLGMTGKPITNIVTNAVVAGFLLTDMRIDCSEHGSLNPYQYPLQLMNRSELRAVQSLAISPGY